MMDHGARDSMVDEGDESSIGEWLDEKCQGAASASPGSSPLCDACIHLFSESQPYGDRTVEEVDGLTGTHRCSPWLRHVKSRDVLSNSSSRGCAFCGLLQAKIMSLANHGEPAFDLEIEFQVFIYKGIASLELYFSFMYLHPLIGIPERSERIYINVVPRSVALDLCFHDLLSIGG